jgi:hypothetical protein
MAAFPSEEQPYRDTIKVPAVLQMPGDPFPTEFYARYPEAFRVPVRLVWRERASPPNEAPSRLRGTGVAAFPEDVDGAPAEAAPEAADDARASPAAPAVGSTYGRADPVARFLRINVLLDRLAGEPAPVPSRLASNPPSIQLAAGPNWNQIARQMGIEPFAFSEALHAYNDYNLLNPNDNISIDPRTGQGTFNGKPMDGTIHDFLP